MAIAKEEEEEEKEEEEEMMMNKIRIQVGFSRIC